jgi:hypothetical protein
MADISATPSASAPSRANNLTATPGVPLNVLLDREFGRNKAELLSQSYRMLITEMKNNKFSDGQIFGAIVSLENNMVQRYCDMFKRSCHLDESMVREWLVGLVNSQAKSLKNSGDFDITAQINAGGPKSLKSLLNSARENLALDQLFSGDFPVFDVTTQAWDALFGDKDMSYNKAKDAASIGKVIDSLDKLMKWTALVSADPENKMLQILGTSKHYILDDAKAADSVRTGLFELAMESINEKYPPGGPSAPGIQRNKLLAKLHGYLSKEKYGREQDFTDFIKEFVLIRNTDGENNEPCDYLGQVKHSDSILLEYLRELCKSALNEKAAPEKKIGFAQMQEIFATAERAAIEGPYGLEHHQEMLGGKADDIRKLAKKNVDELFRMANYHGFYDWTGETKSVGPDGPKTPGGPRMDDYMRFLLAHKDKMDKYTKEIAGKEPQEEMEVAKEIDKKPDLTAAPDK